MNSLRGDLEMKTVVLQCECIWKRRNLVLGIRKDVFLKNRRGAGAVWSSELDNRDVSVTWR